MNANQQSLASNFLDYFAINIATTPELLRQAYELRYRVYCEEFKYEPADAFPERAEFDEFDEHSVSCLVTHLPTGRTAGCARLVSVSNTLDMPLERYCLDSVHDEYRRKLLSDRDQICEFSRLAVDGVFRRRPRESIDRFGAKHFIEASSEEQRTYPLIAVAVLLSGFALAALTGRPHIFAMMEPFLPRLMQRSGILVKTAGKPMEYHGTRAPYYSTAADAVSNLGPELYSLHEAVNAQLLSCLQKGDTDTRAVASPGA